jgi:tRNA/rRNA methyltransferase
MLLSNIAVVLVRTQGAANIGAAARAMKNMGVTDLRLVGVSARRLGAAASMAVHAGDLLERARRCRTLADAVGDCGLVVGTTRRSGIYRRQAESPAVLSPVILDQAGHRPVAMVFGPEDHGLTREDLKCCQRLLTIETSSEYASLNLAQAVLLCCYELRRHAATVDTERNGPEPAAAAAVDQMMGRLELALLEVGFLNPQNPDPILFALKDLFGRAILQPYEVKVLLGLARQIEWYGKNRKGDEGKV